MYQLSEKSEGVVHFSCWSHLEWPISLTEINDVDDEVCDNRVNSIDRGGLKHITQRVYFLFTGIQLALRNYLEGQEHPASTSLASMKDRVITDEGVQSRWSTIAADWEDDTATLLLNMIVDTWITIRGHSTARAWLESYKLQQKSVQKSKGIESGSNWVLWPLLLDLASRLVLIRHVIPCLRTDIISLISWAVYPCA